MRRLWLLICVIVIGSGVSACGAEQNAPGTVVTPPVINIPYGGAVVTEINMADSDVLGMIKQAIPALAETAKKMAESAGGQAQVPAALAHLDVQGLMESINGISAVRLLVIRYGRRMEPVVFLREFEAGAGKAGTFNKIVTDQAFLPGAFALYAQPDNGGFMAAAYDPQQNMAYAARIVGFVDVPKFIKWLGNTALLFMTPTQSAQGENP